MALWRRRRSLEPESAPDRVHVGCGTAAIPGWWNIDIQPLPGVDQVLDVNARFPFRDLRFVFCEHFIDHLQAR